MGLPLLAAVFDMDDTLYPEIEFVRGGFEAAGRLLDGIAGRPVGGADAFLAVLREEGPFRVFDSGLERLGLAREPELVARLVCAYRSHEPRIRLHAGVPELLRELRQAGLRTAVITDGPPDVQRSKWRALGLDGLVDLVTYAWDVEGRGPCPKPDPGAFRHVEECFGLRGERLVYVGDNPGRDFPPADSCGWRTVRMRMPEGIHRDDPDPAPHRMQVESIAQLRSTLLDMAG